MRRERLLRLLDELGTCPVVLVAAPPGAGKTVLLADWATASPRRVWVTLDQSDRDPHQFWAVVLAALEPVIPTAVERSVQLARKAAPVDTLLGTLLEDLHDVDEEPVWLVVDDLHLLDEAAGGQDFATLLQNLPPWLHLVLSTRRRPPLPIERLEADGRLAAIGFTELRFTPDEAAELMAHLAPDLPSDRVEAAVLHADGWPAALQLKALAARTRQAIPVVHGQGPEGERLVNHYVWREVLRAESPEIRSVLLDVAVAERVAPGLAEALTGRPDGYDLLVEAEERGLFVTALEHDGWLQVHAPVREVLLAEAERRSPEHVREQHRRAAVWFEGVEEYPLALDHWLAAGRPDQALRMLADSSRELYDRGEQATVAQMVPRLSPQLVGSSSEALMQYAFAQLLVSRQEFVDTVSSLRSVLERTDDVDVLTAQRASIFQAQADLVTGDWEAAEHAAHPAVDTVGPEAMSDAYLRFGWNIVARSIALREQWDDHSQMVVESRTTVSRDPERLTAWEGTRALGLALAGRPTDAIRVAAGVRRAADVANLMLLQAELDAAEAVAHFELGDLPAAQDQLDRLLNEPVPAVPYVQGLALVLGTDAALLARDVAGAESSLQQLRAWVEEESTAAGPQGWLARQSTLVALMRDERDEARHWAERDPDPFWGFVGRARVLVAEGRQPNALEELAAARPRCPRHEVVRRLVAGQALAEREAAVKVIGGATALAAQHGLLATVALEGPTVLELAEVAAWDAPQAWMDRLRRAALPGVEVDGSVVGLEPLTDREQQVLRLLPSRLTLREIADELFVSQNTLKFHLRLIYRKLGVNGRAEAVEAARARRRGSR